MLKRHEGLRLAAYLCPAGALTIGYGHTAGVKAGDVIDTAEADRLLRSDVENAETAARALVPSFAMLSPRRQDALVNMAFNLGRSRLAGFRTFLRCVNAAADATAADPVTVNRVAQAWRAAGTNLETTKWYAQVRTRARDLVAIILQG